MLGYRVQHRLHVTRRIGDYAENVADRRLLLQRLVTFADDLRDLCFVSGIGGTTHSLWRIAALYGYRLTASRFNWFAACTGAPSHCRPSAQDKAS